VRILFLGDSITDGMAPSLDRYMLSLGVESEIVGKVSMDVEEATTNVLVLRGLRRRPMSVVVMLGTNPFGTIDIPRFTAAVRAFLGTVRRYTDRVAWIGPWAGADANDRMRVIVENVGWRSADGVRMGLGLARAGENRVHFTSEAYVDLAWRVAAWTSRIGDSRVLTMPRGGARIAAGFGALGAAVVPFVPTWR
jgi:hypothetical protein